MRSVIYTVAVIAAAGLAYLFSTAPMGDATSGTQAMSTQPTSTQAAGSQAAGSRAAGSRAAVTTASSQVMQAAGTLTLRVEDMHCPFACYPSVKSTLESQGNVVSVELDKQEEEGAIDNPQVLIKYDSGFDLTAAMDALSKKGFAKHSVIE